MANIKDDPKVQELLSKAAEQAAKAQEKAVKAAVKAALGNAKSGLNTFIDGAKSDGVSKDVLKALAGAKKIVAGVSA